MHSSQLYYRSQFLYFLLLSIWASGSIRCQTQVGVALFVLNINTIDLTNGLFNADFMLYFFDANDTNISPLITPNFNNIGMYVTFDNFTTGYRYSSTFDFSPYTANYPLDTQSLIIVVEPLGYSVEQMQFFPRNDVSGISPELRLRGWNYTTNSWSATIQNFTYEATNSVVSQYIFTFYVHRPTAVAVKFFLPPSFILVSVLGSFSIPISQSVTRLGIVTSALVAEVLFHTNINVPFTGTIMLADYFIIICYIIIIVAIIENITVIVLNNSESKKAKTMTAYIEARARVLVWLIFPCFFFFLFIPWWAAILCVIGPSLIYVSIRYLYKYAHRYYVKKHDPTKQMKPDETTADNETNLRFPGSNVEAQQDMRKEVIAQEIQHTDKKRKDTESKLSSDVSHKQNEYNASGDDSDEELSTVRITDSDDTNIQ
jgi:hypothetical protein